MRAVCDAQPVPASPRAHSRVDIAQTTTTLTVTPAPASVGQNVTLIARVNGYIPSGTVTFTDGGATLGTASVSAGAATLSLNSLALGSHSLAASYAGDANNAASSPLFRFADPSFLRKEKADGSPSSRKMNR